MKTDNELIAEFIGIRHEKDHAVKSDQKYYHYDALHLMDTSLQFNTSWDWLMPVVQKMQQMDGMYLNDHWRHVSDLSVFASIDTVYKRVVEFIKWYNEHETK